MRKSRVPDESVDGTFWHKLDSLLGGTLRGRQPRPFGMFLTQVDIVPVPICLSVAPGRLLESSVVAETLFAWLRWVGHERGVVSPNNHRGQSTAASSVTSSSGIDSIAL